jgi:hypothetical protein
MVLHLKQERFHVLEKKLVSLNCGKLDETALLYPETELWAGIVDSLCSRQFPSSLACLGRVSKSQHAYIQIFVSAYVNRKLPTYLQPFSVFDFDVNVGK